jgi:hypothetical protein
MATKEFKGDHYRDAVVGYLSRQAAEGNAEQIYYSGEQWVCADKELYELDESWNLRGHSVDIHRGQFGHIKIEADEDVLGELEEVALKAKPAKEPAAEESA